MPRGDGLHEELSFSDRDDESEDYGGSGFGSSYEEPKPLPP